jgi:hypothetical protein
MSTIALIVFVILAAIAALHVAWAFGVRWPAHDERDLVALVVGQTGRTRVPSRLACLQASAAILIGGAGALVAVVFAMRGAAAYVPAWRHRFSQEPFATMDQRCCGPLCLLLAAAFAVLTFRRIVS